MRPDGRERIVEHERHRRRLDAVGADRDEVTEPCGADEGHDDVVPLLGEVTWHVHRADGSPPDASGTDASPASPALAALTRELAADFAPRGIRVNAISPGEIDTAILSPGTETLVAGIPMRRLGTPEEVAKAIYFLCTEQSSYVNGADLHINGGQHV